MDNDKDKAGSLPGRDAGKRAAPTIDLAASDVTENAPVAEAAATPEPAVDQSEQLHDAAASPRRASAAVPWLASGLTGAVAAVVVMGAATLAGWPPKPEPVSTAPLAEGIESNKTGIAALGTRIAKIESDAAKPPPRQQADPAIVTRLDAVEKSLAALRGDLAAARAQGEKTAAALGEIKSASSQGVVSGETQAAPAVDVSAIEERLGKIERATAALSAAAATPSPPQPPAEDPNARKVGALVDLEKAMRHSAPYATALAAARSVVGDSDALKALEPFASTGLPDTDALCKDLLALLPQLSPKPETQPAPSGVIERLQQSFAKLVRVQRTDALASGPAGIIARATAAAQRGDPNGAKTELLQLPPSDRVLVRPWIAKVEGRDKALAAYDQFTMDTLTAISNRAR